MLAIITGGVEVYAQRNQVEISGRISYITSQNIYVKFESTNGIEDGDTLYIRKNESLVPALKVQNHSSISCLCEPFTGNTLALSDTIIAKIRVSRREAAVYKTPSEDQPEQDLNEQVISSMEKVGINHNFFKAFGPIPITSRTSSMVSRAMALACCRPLSSASITRFGLLAKSIGA